MLGLVHICGEMEKFVEFFSLGVSLELVFLAVCAVDLTL